MRPDRAVAHANYIQATASASRALAAATLLPMHRFLEAAAEWATNEGVHESVVYPEARRQRWLGILRDHKVARAIDAYDNAVADAYALYVAETRPAFAAYVDALQRRFEEAA